MKWITWTCLIFIALAGTPAIADDFDDKVQAAESEIRQLLCDFKRVADNPNATVKEQVKASEKMRFGGKRIEKEYGENVAGAASVSVASEGGNLVCPGENRDVKLTQGLARIFCDYHNELSRLREINLYGHRSDADEYRQKVAGQFVPHKLKALAKVFGRDRVEEALSDFKSAGTDLTSTGSLNCYGR